MVKAMFVLFRSYLESFETRGVIRKLIATMLLAVFSQGALAETYTLVFDSNCSSSGERLEFSCEPEPSFRAQKATIFLRGGEWLGLEGASWRVFALGLVKNDEFVIVFDYPVLYSGIATIVLFKKTGRFYLSEIAYSDALKVQEVSIESGRFSVGE
jgi:hypothetical protein